jgi:hypothetical protein
MLLILFTKVSYHGIEEMLVVMEEFALQLNVSLYVK